MSLCVFCFDLQKENSPNISHKLYSMKLIKYVTRKREREKTHKREEKENKSLWDGCPIVDVCLSLFLSFSFRSPTAYNCINSYRFFSFSFLSLTRSLFFALRYFTFFVDLYFSLSRSLLLYCARKICLRRRTKKGWLTDWPKRCFFLFFSNE